MFWNPFNRSNKKNQKNEDQTSYSRNPNFNVFQSVNNDIEKIVAQRSVIGKSVYNQTQFANPIWATMGINSDMLLMPVASNKVERLNQYRQIAKYPEAQFCLEEIADEFIHENENGECIYLNLPDGKENINEIRKNIIHEEFKRFMNLFNIRDEGYYIIKQFLVEGELAWENIIDPEQPELGIRGVKFLPAEYYETLIDTQINKPVGIIFDTENFARDIKEILSNTYMSSSQIFNRFGSNYSVFSILNKNCIPLLYPQLTYINSGDLSYDKLISYPLIEKTKVAYYQLALLQESMVILRVTRAPERLLFNVSTGRMADPNAHEYVRNFANSLKAKKVAKNDGTGDVASVYNPVSMLEQYVFGKSSDSEGTSVESVGSSADYEQIADVEYFLRRFMKQFKVPYSRYKTPENTIPSHDQLTYEEHSFLRMIVRFQRRFALGFKRSFITNLKLRGIWEKYNLHDEDIDIQFVKPSLYDLLEIQKVMEAKMNIYTTSLGNDGEISKISGMKKYLNFNEKEIKENFENIIKEKMLLSLAEYYSGQVSEKQGLEGYENPIKFKTDSEKENLDSLSNKQSDKKAEGEESGDTSEEGSDDSTGGEEASADTGEEEDSGASEEAAAEPPPAPTFGLG